MIVAFWMGGTNTVSHDVAQAHIDACYALPKTADRWAYWRGVTGDNRIQPPVLIWAPQKRAGVYGPMCRKPDVCIPKGYCPLDPNCAD